MKQFLQVYKKTIVSVSLFLSVLIGTLVYASSHLEKTVALLSKIFLGDSVQIEKIEIQKSKISLEGISMDLEGEPFVRIPHIEAERLSFVKLGLIKVSEGDVYVKRKQDGKWNVDRYLSKEKTKKIDLKYYKPITNIPISKVLFENIRAHYVDENLDPDFQKTISFEGEVFFDEKKGISALARGRDRQENYEIRYSGETMPYDVFLDARGINLQTYLQEYLKSGSVEVEAGNAEAHLHFDYYGNYGDVAAEIPKIVFANKIWQDAKLTLLLDGKEINAGLDYKEEGEVKNILAFYDYEKQQAHMEAMDFYYDNIIFDLEKKKDWLLSFQMQSNVYPEVIGKINFEDKEKQLDFSVNSNILQAKGTYLKEEKYLKLYEKKHFSLLYDIKNTNLREGQGVLPFHVYDYDAEVKFQAKDNIVQLEKIQVSSEEAKGSLEANGKVDLTKKEVDLEYKANHFVWTQKIAEQDFFAQLALFGTIHYDQEKGAEVSSKGEVEALQFGEYSIEGLRTDLEYQKDTLDVFALENRFLNAEGQLDFATQNSNLEVEVRELDSDTLKLSYPKFHITHAIAKITGNMKNPLVNGTVEEAKVVLLREKENTVRGNFTIKDHALVFYNAELDQNKVSGEYHFDDNSYQVQANIIEERFSDYYGFHDLYYRLIGEAVVEGKGRELEVSVKSTLDKIFYQGKKLPDVYWEGKYYLGKEGYGKVDLPIVQLQTRKEKKLLTLEGNIDLNSETVEASLQKQDLSLGDIKEYTQLDYLTGILSIEGEVKGSYKNPNYWLKVNGRELKIKDSSLDLFSVEVAGDAKKVSLKQAETAYQNNKLQMTGYYSVGDGNYDVSVKAPKIDWSALQSLVSDYGITKLSGTSDLDLHFTNKTSQGKFDLKDISLQLPKQYLNIKNIDGSVHFSGKDMIIDKIAGTVNQGKIGIFGKIHLPELSTIGKDLKFLESLSYQLHLQSDGIHYEVPNIFFVDLSSNIRFENHKIRGNIEILRGLIEDAPNEYQSYSQILKSLFSDKKNEAIKIAVVQRKEQDIKELLGNLLDLDLSLWIREGIKLDIPNLNVAVEDVKGNVTGGLTLIGKKKRYALLGNIEVEQASLMVNANTFSFGKLLLSFNDSKVYLPEFQPTLLADSTVDVNGDQVRFGLQGKLDNLHFTISSRNGNTSGNLNSLLTGEFDVSEDNASYVSLLQNLIGGQLTQTVIGPITKWIRKVFHVEKFKVTSRVSTQSNKKSPNSESSLSVGAKMEIRDNIYKDKLYWNFTGNLYNSEAENGVTVKNKDNKVMDEYDFTIQYPYSKTKIFEIGVGKLPEKFYQGNQDKKEAKPNYHIGIRIEKKMDDILDIFKE